MSSRPVLHFLLLVSFSYAPALAKEYVTFTSGFSLEADSHSFEDQVVSFHVGSGIVQVPAIEVARIEAMPELNPNSDASRPVPVNELLSAAAVQAGLEPEFVRSVALAESALQQDALSKKGAEGLMQLMPETAKELGVNARIASENARGGANYLRALLLRYNGNAVLALAAYNAGPGAVQRYGGVPPFLETRKYIVRVLAAYARQQKSSKRTNTRSAESSVSTPSAIN